MSLAVFPIAMIHALLLVDHAADAVSLVVLEVPLVFVPGKIGVLALALADLATVAELAYAFLELALVHLCVRIDRRSPARKSAR